MCKCCHCCSFDSLNCRLRTLKALGALLFLFGTVFALAGIAIGFLPDLYFQVVALPDVLPQYILFAFLVITTGFVAVGTGMAAIYIAKTMSDDDCSTRGLAILALLTIVCSLATVGVPAWPLYENGYFLGIPPQTTMNVTTSIAATTSSMPVQDAMSTMSTGLGNGNATVTNGTSMDMNGTVSQMNATMNATSMENTTSSNSTSNETMSMVASGANMTMPNMTLDITNMTMANMTSDNANMTMANMTSDNANMTMSNMTSSDNSSQSMSSPDNSTMGTSGAPMTTPDVMTGTTGNYTTGNSTESSVTREPIDYDEWLLIITPFGIICCFAFVFVLFGLFIFCIACCCPERSEIVDDIDLYKS